MNRYIRLQKHFSVRSHDRQSRCLSFVVSTIKANSRSHRIGIISVGRTCQNLNKVNVTANFLCKFKCVLIQYNDD